MGQEKPVEYDYLHTTITAISNPNFSRFHKVLPFIEACFISTTLIIFRDILPICFLGNVNNNNIKLRVRVCVYVNFREKYKHMRQYKLNEYSNKIMKEYQLHTLKNAKGLLPWNRNTMWTRVENSEGLNPSYSWLTILLVQMCQYHVIHHRLTLTTPNSHSFQHIPEMINSRVLCIYNWF